MLQIFLSEGVGIQPANIFYPVTVKNNKQKKKLSDCFFKNRQGRYHKIQKLI